MLKDAAGTAIGRVAAFYSRDQHEDQPTGGMGFFECTEDSRAAFMLFDACRDWLAAHGMEAMDGPINFGERDRWWGLLTDGFDREPNYMMPYTLPYYPAMFEAYGFQNYFNQYTYYMDSTEHGVTSVIHPSVLEKARRIYDSGEFDFRTIEKKHLEKYAEDFRSIYNQAWGNHAGVAELTAAKAQAMLGQMKPILDERLIWFAYHQGRPVAFFLTIPEMNQLFKHVGGRLNWLGKLKIGYHQLLKTNHKALGLVFGVVPDFQGRGMESAIALAYTRYSFQPGFQYRDFEMNWVGDFNIKMMRFVSQLGGKIVKTHVTYRYLFDRQQPFKRCPPIR